MILRNGRHVGLDRLPVSFHEGAAVFQHYFLVARTLIMALLHLERRRPARDSRLSRSARRLQAAIALTIMPTKE